MFPLESLFKKPSFQLYDQNPTSTQDISPFFSNFPSPFFDEHELPLNQILPHHQSHLNPLDQCVPPDQSTPNTSEYSPPKSSINKLKGKASADQDQPISNCHVAPSRRRNLGTLPRKRTGKKDRHSKILTAQGIRDRRMRLSLQIARKFFDLQDMLGYDKASKTIEWLFNQSKKAIKDLIKENAQGNNITISTSDAKSESFISECEVVSGIEENSNNEIKAAVEPSGKTPLCVKGSVGKLRKTASKPNMRESREKARARARCRTREKMMMKGLENCGQTNQNNLEKLGSSNSPFDQDPGPINGVSLYDVDYSPLIHQSSDVGTIENLLGSNYQCSDAVSCSVDPNSSFMGFLGSWDLLNIDRLSTSQYAVITNQEFSLAGNPNSIYSDSSTLDFPLFHHQ